MLTTDLILTPPPFIQRESPAEFAQRVVSFLIDLGVRECCICPGLRNLFLFEALKQQERIKIYTSFDERSAAFFALGRSRTSEIPVAVMTTSGTAAGELLPAAMEAHYTGAPLLLVTTDRPKRFRGSGAPQAAEQKEIFGVYTALALDLEANDLLSLSDWDRRSPVQLNLCFEDPLRITKDGSNVSSESRITAGFEQLDLFLEKVQYPLVILSTLTMPEAEAIVPFLLQLNAPLYIEAISQLREDCRLAPLIVRCGESLWKDGQASQYPIDGILRIGGIPTVGIWRDLETREGEIAVCSISSVPFTGLSWGTVIHTDLTRFFSNYALPKCCAYETAQWLATDRQRQQQLLQLYQEEPFAEQTLFHRLSEGMPLGAQVYLGNSSPIREWDLFATYVPRRYQISASRGLNGIDGQLSTFFGISEPFKYAWAIFGDLTVLYDLSAPWLLSQLKNRHCTIVVINNKGSQLFSRHVADARFLGQHSVTFGEWARMWALPYESWQTIPEDISAEGSRIVEIFPDHGATARFWQCLKR